jgi:RND family efflux transporter MFP subunit
LALALVVAAGACAAEREVATYRVERQSFVHRVRAEGHLSPTQATTISVPTQVRQAVRIAWRAEDGAALSAGDVVVRFDPLEMERELEKGRADLEQSQLKGSKAEATSAERAHGVDRQRAEAELQLDVAERFEKTDDSIYSRHEIIESQIDTELAAQRKEQAAELAVIHQDLAQAETALLDIETRRANQRIEQARTGLDELEVRAPHSGLLTWSRDWRGEIPEVGQQVWAGQPLAQIPSLERMKADVFVLEADAGGLAPGQGATVRVEAHPETALRGSVTRVDAVAKAPYRGTPLQYFGVELELEPEAAADPRLRPGQRVTATLRLEARDDALVIPRQALMTDRDDPYVWVKQGRRFVARAVTLGPLSAAQVVVEKGLEDGDVVALEPVETEAEPGREPAEDAGREGGAETGSAAPTAAGS